jgi:sortase family protein
VTRHAILAAALLAAVALLGGSSRSGSLAARTSAIGTSATGSSPRSTAAPASAPLAQTRATTGTPAGPAPVRADPAGTRPVRIRIAAIGVNSALQARRVERNGTLQPPSRWQRAGWFAGGIRPGDVGPALIAGHVDSVSGPAVFFRLHELRRADRVEIVRADGSTLTFVVDGLQRVPKRTFPTAAVYGPTALRVLRLVTCGGDFDRRAHSYVDNLVITTHLVDS